MINRLLPMKVQAVGAFVLLDHFTQEAPVPAAMMEAGPSGDFAHPHRGIATVSYLLEGDMQHFDSRGHSGRVGACGVQWMKSGNGIVHDEWATLDTDGTKEFEGFQFWVNLQPESKAQEPDYRALQADDLPLFELPANSGSLRVVIGKYRGQTSPVPRDSDHFLYHLHLKPGACVSLKPSLGHEVAMMVLNGGVKINGVSASKELVHFDVKSDGKVRVQNSDTSADLMFFGGEPYRAPIVSEAQYVMNSSEEIKTAFADYASGAYGRVDYSSYGKI